MDSGRKKHAGWMRLASLGVELGAAVAGLTLFGYWIDRHYDSAPVGLLTGAALGLVGGLYNLIRSALRALRENDAAGGSKS